MDASFKFANLYANGVAPKDYTAREDGNIYNVFTKRPSNRLLTYFVRNNESLELKMKFTKDALPRLTMYESSYDLLENKEFFIPEREASMMPKPFVLNDAIMVKKTVQLEYSEIENDIITPERPLREQM